MIMQTAKQNRIKELIDRIARINAADEWAEEINPTQWTALSYLARANRFSRSPSQVADFMTATRGTVSQTLKALAKKGLVTETRSDQDKRSISYSTTDRGDALVHRNSTLHHAVSSLGQDETSFLLSGLEDLMRKALKQRGLRAFGVCETCTHHRKTGTGGYCALLQESLSRPETKQICHEHAEAA